MPKRIKVFGTNDDNSIVHSFFSRVGGVSNGIFSSLNCGIGSGDNPEHITENRARVAAAIGVDPGNIIALYQVHGSTCIKVTKPFAERPEADAAVTDIPGLALSVLTADCAPVLFYGRAGGKPIIGAAHAGWKGALGGVLDSTVKTMKEYGAETIRAAIGPCIGKRSYEVSQSFADPFLKDDPENERFFMEAQKPGHLHFDLAGYCAARLYNCGLGQVSIAGVDTFANEADYFSFRRTTHRKEPDYGRQISVIAISNK
ncbi:MAG: peptidoglycan editing factor PgeF [Alphaproteobacteria bacterium]